MRAKKILVVDEQGFARICRALLSLSGIVAELSEGFGTPAISAGEYDLVITSYPYGAEVVRRMGENNTPVLFLADCLSPELLESIGSVRRSCCMIKPLDFDKFHRLVERMLADDNLVGGYEIA